MDQPGVSLVTYSYNDHAFADAMIVYAKNFVVPLREIVVTDDASIVPYTPAIPENTVTCPVIPFRLETNAGSAHVKRHGLNKASGSIILSLDADIRPHSGWLRDSLPLLKDTSVGLVGATCIPARNAGFLSAALHRACTVEKVVRETGFTSGGCLLFRRDVWERIKGLDDLPEDTFEDLHLCQKMQAHGYRILQNNRLPVYETRNLHRLNHVRRSTRYEIGVVAHIVQRYGVERFINDLGFALHTALEYHTRYGDPILVYVFLVKAAFMFHTLSRHFGQDSSVALPGEIDVRLLPLFFLSSLSKFLEGNSKTMTLLQEDLIALGMPSTTDVSPLAVFAPLLQPLEKSGAMNALESEWIIRYRNEDASQKFDRHYTEVLAP